MQTKKKVLRKFGEITMMKNEINLLWIVFWVLVGVGISLLSFKALKKNVETIKPPQEGKEPQIGKLIFQRFGILIAIALLLYLALRTEPIAAVALAITITVITWVQVLVFNSKIKKQEERLKETEFGSN